MKAAPRPATSKRGSRTGGLASIEIGNGQLLAAAAALFRRDGYHAATTRSLGEALGVRSASLYYHMGKKEDLLYEICVDSLDRIQVAVQDALAGEADPLARIRLLMRVHLTTALADTDKHVTMLSELKSLTPVRRRKVVALRDRYEALVCQTLLAGQTAGVVRSDFTAKYLMLALLNLLNWTIFWYRPRGDMSPTQLGSMLADIFLSGVRTGDKSRKAD